jgi:drug/metabolite transporter (DMT)-like permease
MILVVVMYAAFAATFSLAKIAMGYVASPLFFIALRMCVAGVGMTTAALAFNQTGPEITRKDVRDIFLAGFFAIFVAFGAEFWSLQYVSSIKVNIFYSLSPFMTALLAYSFGAEQISWRKLLGLSIGFLGMLPLALPAVNTASTNVLPTNVYDLALLVSVGSAAYAWFIIKRLMVRGYPLLLINGLMTLIGGAMCALAHGVISYTSQATFIPNVSSWSAMLMCMSALILISNVFGYTMYGFLLRRYSMTFLSFSGFMCPLFGLMYSYFFMNEPLSWMYALALACVFAGLSLFYWDEQATMRIKN